MSRPARLFDGVLRPGRRHAGMGIAAHTASRHCELCQTVHESEANMSVCYWLGEAQKVDSHGWPCVTRPYRLPASAPPPCLSSKRPTQTLIGHPARLLPLGAPLPATVPACRYSLGRYSPFLRLQAYSSRRSSSSSSPISWKPATLFYKWPIASCLHTTSPLRRPIHTRQA